MSAPALPSAALARTLVPGYEIRRVLGSGSCGLVYLACDQRQETLCALKEFPATPAAVQNFFRELSALFTLNHPHVIRCLNLIYGQGAKNYLVFEYAEGGTLRDRLEEDAPPSVEEALTILRQLALGLEEAHRHHLVHGDLKPENILVCRQESGLVYKLGDLGVAQSRAQLGELRRTTGSPAYMAPEQFYDAASEASDFYALGVMFYELLCGRRPFDGSPGALFMAHTRQAVDLSPIEAEPLRRLVADLLGKQPRLRPASAAEIVARIDACRTDVAPPARRAGPEKFPPLPRFRCEPQEAELVLEKAFPGGRLLFAPQPQGRPLLWIADDRGTDRFDLESRRTIPGYFSEPLTAISGAAEGEVTIATAGWAGRHQVEENRTVRLFSTPIRGRALQADPIRQRLYLADSRRVIATDLTGRQIWQVACANYYLEPRLLILAGGQVAVTSGPVQPSIFVIDETGATTAILPVGGPVVELWVDSQSDRFCAIVIGLGAEEPALLVTFADGRQVGQVEIGEGIYGARFHGDFLTVHDTGRHTRLLSPAGIELGQWPSGGNVLSEAWLARDSIHATLSQEAHRTTLRLRRITPRRLLSIETIPEPCASLSPTLI